MLKQILNSLILPSSGIRYPALDGVRALAVASVLICHLTSYVGYPMPFPAFSASGVMVFFTLSAFLLYSAWTAGKTPTVRQYYSRRFWRIMPAYGLAVCFGFGVGSFLDQPISIKNFLTYFFFLQTLWWEPGFSTIGQTWSMSTEVQFYLLLPFLAWIGYRREWIWLIVAAFLIFMQSLFKFQPFHQIWMNFPLIASPFLFGMLAAAYTSRISVRTANALSILGAAGLLGLPVLDYFKVLSIHPEGQSGWMISLLNFRGLLFSLSAFAIVLGFSKAENLLSRFFSSRPLRILGITGYGTFLLHFPILLLLVKLFGATFGTLLAGPLSLLAGALSYICVEFPLQRIASRHRETFAQPT